MLTTGGSGEVLSRIIFAGGRAVNVSVSVAVMSEAFAETATLSAVASGCR